MNICKCLIKNLSYTVPMLETIVIIEFSISLSNFPVALVDARMKPVSKNYLLEYSRFYIGEMLVSAESNRITCRHNWKKTF